MLYEMCASKSRPPPNSVIDGHVASVEKGRSRCQGVRDPVLFRVNSQSPCCESVGGDECRAQSIELSDQLLLSDPKPCGRLPELDSEIVDSWPTNIECFAALG